MAKKLWKKPSVIVINIGKCKYCQAEMVNTESFVAFYGGEKAHYDCMKKDDFKKLIEKEKQWQKEKDYTQTSMQKEKESKLVQVNE